MKNHKTNTLLSPTRHRRRRAFTYCLCLAMILTALAFNLTALGAGGGPLEAINNLSSMLFGIIKAVGVIAALFGVVQLAMSISSHDSGQRITGFMALLSGLLMFFAKEILALIGVSV